MNESDVIMRLLCALESVTTLADKYIPPPADGLSNLELHRAELTISDAWMTLSEISQVFPKA